MWVLFNGENLIGELISIFEMIQSLHSSDINRIYTWNSVALG